MKRFWIRPLVSLVVLCVLAELVLRVAPGALPLGYLESFPMRGIEFGRPGVLSETPIEALPMPWIAGPWDGPPPADLVEKGLVSPTVDLDRRRYPRAVLPADVRGLPNPEALERADVVMVGDSFMVAASVREPRGLVVTLEAELETSVYDLSVAGVGPQREAWLLGEVGLELEPELVLWCFYGGNDLVDARRLRDRIEAGVRTHADEADHRAPPLLRVPDVVRWLFAARSAASDPVPSVGLESPNGVHPFWFLPRHLYMLTMPVETLRGHRGWAPTQAALRASRDSTRAQGGRFAVVYLPSKAQVYLPHVEQDAARIHRMLTFDGVDLGSSPEQLFAAMLANRGALEELILSFCEDEGIPFFSATPALAALAERGELGYLTCDTHWAASGQTAVARALAPFCRELLGR